MIGWNHQLDGHEFEQTPGVSEGQGSLVCCSPWGRKELDTLREWTTTNTIKHYTIWKKKRVLSHSCPHPPQPQLLNWATEGGEPKHWLDLCQLTHSMIVSSQKEQPKKNLNQPNPKTKTKTLGDPRALCDFGQVLTLGGLCPCLQEWNT